MELKDIKMVLSKDQRLKAAFKSVRIDLDLMDEKQNSLKRSANEWITFLNHENQSLKANVTELERKLERMERSLDDAKFSVLKTV